MDPRGHKLSRRRLLSLGLLSGVLATVSARFGANPMQELQAAQEETASAKYALIIDTTVCTGCGACIAACNMKNNLPEGQSYIHPLLKGDNHLRWFLMVQCQHCEILYCNETCPTSATYIRDDGVVIINEKLCVGCKACLYACPYQARIFNDVAADLTKYPTDQQIVTYCYTGHTGQVGAVSLALLGYDVTNLKYGMMGWTDDEEVLAQPYFDGPPGYPVQAE